MRLRRTQRGEVAAQHIHPCRGVPGELVPVEQPDPWGNGVGFAAQGTVTSAVVVPSQLIREEQRTSTT